ncbi:MAG: undecaprenyldiphospho-muramoylpentapeptide beta-N-acetylglucosaminyltransferase [Desulfobacteraceae bacterium]|nr:undecaprenyldiphospho-muramoylpentapeptide beta-N-acetylglucosaminyltransferase [Desulfobacteraceae bacterium]
MIVTGGGTGGHLFPGIAVAEFVLAARPGSEVLFVSTDRQVDQRALAGRPFRTAAVRGQGLKGMGAVARLRALLQLPLALGEAMGLVRRFRPQLVLGVGGYVTGPVVLAARLLGIPTGIHEQNSVPGLANRWLGRLVDRIFLSIPESESWFPAGRAVLTGNPVRCELLSAAAGKPGPATLLVLGGSQGAHRVNTLVVEALTGCRDRLPAGFKVIHQTGAQDESRVAEAYRKSGIEAQVGAFFNDMAALYGQAALVVSRAGATTLAELTVAGKPALLIPYPYAADNHQEKNAEYLVAGGAARMYREAELTGATLGGEVLALLTAPERLARMAARSASLAKPEATAAIMAECLRLIESKNV